MRRLLRYSASVCLLLTLAVAFVAQFNGIYVIKGWHNIYVIGCGIGYWKDAAWENWSTVQSLPASWKWSNFTAMPSIALGKTPEFLLPWWLLVSMELFATGIFWLRHRSAVRAVGFPLIDEGASLPAPAMEVNHNGTRERPASGADRCDGPSVSKNLDRMGCRHRHLIIRGPTRASLRRPREAFVRERALRILRSTVALIQLRHQAGLAMLCGPASAVDQRSISPGSTRHALPCHSPIFLKNGF
jgi:hypothetical protein